MLTVTNHLSAEDRRSIVTSGALRDLRAGLDAHRSRMRAARIMHEQRTERRAIRDAQREALEQREQLPALERAALRQNIETMAAARRDAYRAALAYPMEPVEILRAAMDACAMLPDDTDRDETVSELVRVVIRRHGRTPLRCDVGADWLRAWAKRIYLEEQRKREHKTGMRKAAEQLGSWHSADLAAAREAGDSSADRVYWRAMGMPAPEPEPEPLSAAQLAKRLQLNAKQAGALFVALQSHKRATVAMSSAECFHASTARAILRKRYPNSEALLVALRGPRYAARIAVGRAQLIERKRASIAARGSHLPARTLPAASALSLRRFPRTVPLSAGGRLEQLAKRSSGPRTVGPTVWNGDGDGYSGACSCLHLYRTGQRRTDS